MRDLIVGFLKNPGPQTYAELRAAAVADYQPEAPGESQLWRMLSEGQVAQAQELLPKIMYHSLVSPSFHLAVARLAESQGDADRADMEHFFAVKLREQLLASGDGSLERPYVVTRVEEEYTVLAAREVEARNMTMVLAQGRWLDVIHTKDGSQVYFDVGFPLGAYGRR